MDNGYCLGLIDWNAERPRPSKHLLIVSCELNHLPPRPQKLDRRQVQSIERAHGYGERFKRTRKNRRREFNQRHPADQGPHFVTV